MNLAEILKKTLRLLYELVDRLSTQKAVSEALSMTDGQVSRLLLGSRKISLEESYNVLGFLEVSPRLVIETVFEDEPVTPVQVLRAFRKGDGLSSRTFLESVAARLPPAEVPGQSRLEPGPSAHRPMLLGLEEQRFQDAVAVKARLEELVLGWLQEEPASPELLGDVAVALSIWASIQRIHDHHDDASTAYTYAFAFVASSDDPWILGLLYQKVASLMMDLNRTRRGIELLKDAVLYFTQASDHHCLAKVYIDLGTLYSSLGDKSDAYRWLRIGLASIPEGSHLNRFAACFELAWAYSRDKQPDLAQKFLSEARILLPAGSQLLPNLLWLEGDLFLDLADKPAAAKSYSAARALLISQKQVGDAVLVGLDLAQVLWSSHERKDLTELVLELLQSTKSFKGNVEAQRALQKLGLHYYRGKMSFELLGEVRQQLEAALNQPRERPHQL